MWIIMLLACLNVLHDCKAQQMTTSDAYTVTQYPRTTPGDGKDNTRPPVTVSIQSGQKVQKGTIRTPQYKISDQSLVYPAQWRPILMPINRTSSRDQTTKTTENEPSVDQYYMPIPFHRPDPGLNWTVPLFPYPHPSPNVNYPLRFINPFVHETSVPPEYFYPYSLNLDPQRESHAIEIKEVQNSSDSVLNLTAPESQYSSLEESQSRILPPGHMPFLPLAPVPPVSDYHDPREIFSHFSPVYYPTYPFPPRSSGPLQSPQPGRADEPYFDREEGSEDVESASAVPRVTEIPVAETPVADLNRKETISTILPSRDPPSLPPPEALSFAVGGFPFGVLPPPPFSPFVPNPDFPRVLPVNSFPSPSILRKEKENIEAGAISPPLQADDRLPIEVDPVALPPENTLQSPSGEITNLPNINQDVLPGEKPNVVKLPYEFGFDMNDGRGTDQHRKEVSDGSGVITGSYGYKDVFGVYRLVNYIADKNGFRAVVKSNEPGVASSGSADVIVMAERPPPRAVSEMPKATEPQAVIQDETVDLVAEGSEKDVVPET